MHYLINIWKWFDWLFDEYLMIIWWLFNFNYLMIAWSSTLMIVWAMIVWWLYGDFFYHNYLWFFYFSTTSRLVGLIFPYKPSHGTVAHLEDGSLLPAHIAACEEHWGQPATCCRSYTSSSTTILSFMVFLTSQALCPAPPAPFFCER